MTPRDWLTDADDVAAGIGHQEITHAALQVVGRTHAGDALARHAPERPLQAVVELRVQAVDIDRQDVAGAVQVLRLMGPSW